MAKKKFLILTENLGKTAPGIVFERLVNEIASRHEVVVCCLNDYTQEGGGRVHSRCSDDDVIGNRIMTPSTKARLSRLSLSLFGDDWSARINARALRRVYEGSGANLGVFDYIFSLVSFRHTSPLLLAEQLVDAVGGQKSIAYFVDAIPAPLGWSEDNLEFRGLKRFAVQRVKHLDVLFSSNAQMLDYQLRLLEERLSVRGGVLFNPISCGPKNFPPPPRDKHNFLYTGGIYGKRTAKHLFNALKKVLRVNPNVYLVFVGTQISEQELCVLDDWERSHVVIESFVRDLDPFYKDAVALIDIDADMDNDVFLSSKVTNYLPVNRIILSETGSNSPASKLLGGLESIVQCAHDPDEIAECIIKVVEMSLSVNFDDRLQLINAFSVGAVVSQMEASLGEDLI